jgi:hypothetical protein
MRATIQRLRDLFRRRRVIGRFEDGSPRVKVTHGPTMLQLVKGIRPGQQPDGGKR